MVLDIVINIFGKINVDLGPKIGSIVTFLKKLQFPTLGWTENTSPIDDGGDAAINSHDDYILKKKELSDLEKEKDKKDTELISEENNSDKNVKKHTFLLFNIFFIDTI